MNLMTHEQRKTAVRAEVAQEMMGNVIAHHSEQIALEEAKPTPDVKVIEQAHAEKVRVRLERTALNVDDRKQIEDVIARYKPIVHELYAG